MRLSLTTTGLLDPRQLSAWTQHQRQAVRSAVASGMQSGGREVREAARAEMRRAFNVRRKGFVTSMTAKVWDKKQDRLPVLRVGSKIPWLGLHQHGGSVTGNLLIPLLPGRMSPRQFKAVVEGLLRSGNAYFMQKNGKVLLMAENLQENAALLGRFKRAERLRTGNTSIRRGQEIPIAVLVKRVDLKRRFNLAGGVQRALPALARAIQQELDRVGR